MVRSRFFVGFLFATGWALASQYAVLQNGFRLQAQTVEKREDKYYLKTDTGEIVLPATQVAFVEEDDYVAPPVPPEDLKQTALPRPVKQPSPIHEIITAAADRNGLPAAFVRSVAQAESAFNQNAVSRAGAIGVMQLMPATAADLKADPNDPEQNIEAGTRYLRDLLTKYNGDAVKALAAYNAGSGAVDRYNGVPPYRETITYVDRVIRDYKKSLP